MPNAREVDLCTDAMRRIRDCQELIAYVVSSDGTRRRWIGSALRGACGKPYPAPYPACRMLACEKCASNPIFGLLLHFGLDPRACIGRRPLFFPRVLPHALQYKENQRSTCDESQSMKN